jgi:hypothetical protein
MWSPVALLLRKAAWTILSRKSIRNYTILSFVENKTCTTRHHKHRNENKTHTKIWSPKNGYSTKQTTIRERELQWPGLGDRGHFSPSVTCKERKSDVWWSHPSVPQIIMLFAASLLPPTHNKNNRITSQQVVTLESGRYQKNDSWIRTAFRKFGTHAPDNINTHTCTNAWVEKRSSESVNMCRRDVRFIQTVYSRGV